ncbi:MAG: phage tail assembly chaperone [Rectinemataceae bacterium]
MQLGGKDLRITPASFADASALQKAIGRALKGSRFDLSSLPGSSTEELPAGFLESAIGLILSVAVSDEVEDALFRCSERALLGTEKIDRDFFEAAEHRELYYPIMYEVITVNVGPFLKGLASKFGALAGIAKSIPK